ncbi:Fur family transcriptional regulator [Cytobacillus luteolus]|uniref:Fur family transcriptional regulator n=1 Tax=Litchfieldia luteola TaxID=682179 RepID=UPI001CB0D029|nr:Fur family transcriptional regulator [Cytobacillus luteolus]MBP1941926.1 Fur family peroxide stress response transcriptional regulator [Cytobacillus luteolus]
MEDDQYKELIPFLKEDDQYKELIPFLKEHGLRITPQRLIIIKTIMSLKGHPTVDDIHREIPYISVATIYNNIKLFVKLNILKELPYGNGFSKYELHNSNHYHVICETCGAIVDFNYPSLVEIEQIVRKLTNFYIRTHQFEIYGECTVCQADK